MIYLTVTYYILVVLTGLCVGSFLNVVIYRVPNNMSVSFPPSHCPNCNYKLKWYDNIPILSYIILKGKCRGCKTHISFRYTVVEFLNMALWVTIFAMFYKSNLAYAIIMMIITSVLLCVACIDYEQHFIPDRFHFIILFISIFSFIFDKSEIYYERLIGFGGALVIFLIFYGLGYLIYKKEGLGLGDVKLMSVCGLALGYQKMFLSILISTIVASVVLIIIVAKTKDRTHEFAFAPFLVFGMIVSIIFGDMIIQPYLRLLGF